MALGLYGNRVKDTTSAINSTTVTLSNAPPTGYQSFNAGIGDGNACYYKLSDGTNWEFQYGIYTNSSTSLARAATPLDSSNAGAQATFSGTVTVTNVVSAQYLNTRNWGVASALYVNYNAGSGSFTTVTPTSGTIYYVPVHIKQFWSSCALHINFTTLSANVSSLTALGIYDNLKGAPNNRLAQQTGMNSSTTGGATGDNATSTLTPSKPQPPGLYWLACLCSTASPTVEAPTTANASGGARDILGASSTTDTATHTGHNEVNAALPATATPTVANVTMPYLGVGAIL